MRFPFDLFSKSAIMDKQDRAYPLIEDHAVIGNMKTIALVTKDGEINFFCFPRFDSPAIFCSLLDSNKGGYMKLVLAKKEKQKVTVSKQFYVEESNILATRFHTDESLVEMTDYMPVRRGTVEDRSNMNGIVRRITCKSGDCVQMKLVCKPTFDFAQTQVLPSRIDENTIEWKYSKDPLVLKSNYPLKINKRGEVSCLLCVKAGDEITFVLQPKSSQIELNDEENYFVETLEYWREWLSKCTYSGRWRELLLRSALVLKLLTYEETGAILAAATTSLPESELQFHHDDQDLKNARNWDYRYTWIRDASFTMYSLIKIGLYEEAAHFVDFMEKICEKHLKHGEELFLPIMFSICPDQEVPPETILDLDGYRGAKPVRIGNAAATQYQLDIFGEFLDALDLYNRLISPISYDFWKPICRMLEYLEKHWQDKDEGIWEVRGGRRNFTYSKIMCWVAFDRALKLAQKQSLPLDPQTEVRWKTERNKIYNYVNEKAWCEKRQAYVQYIPDEDESVEDVQLDASVLKMPLVGFMAANDPRILSTLKAIEDALSRNGLIKRYETDELDGEEGSFTICTLWFVEALSRAGRFHPDMLFHARSILDNLILYANHVGLLSEEISKNGTLLGNFPQAFSHLALIAAIVNLNKMLVQVKDNPLPVVLKKCK